MEKQLNKVCGADIHKKFLIATILSRDGIKQTERFGMTLDDLLAFKNWVIENGCEQVAVESTGGYWIPIYSVLEGSVDLIVANAYKIKHTPGRKTDKIDSQFIAELCLNGMIEGRYILNCLLEGLDIEDILKGIKIKSIKKKSNLIR